MSGGRQAAFKRAYAAAFADPRLNSRRARDFWIDLEVLRDALAGPLYSVQERGDCDYVYSRDDGYFSGVNEPAQLRERLGLWRDQLIERLDGFLPASADETADLARMRQAVEAIGVVAGQACDIEQDRWQNERPGR